MSPDDQLSPESALEERNLPRDGRLRQVQRLGRSGERAMPYDGPERRQLLDLEHVLSLELACLIVI
jgi:hypothetical protein